MTTAATPPTTPPAIAPVEECLSTSLLLGSGGSTAMF